MTSPPAAAAHTRSATKERGTGRRFVWRSWAASTVALILSTTPAVSLPAMAADAPSSWWWDTYEVQSVQDQGLTGEGVKVAVIDGSIDPDLPAFSGRSLRVDDRPLCEEYSGTTSTETNFDAVHGSTITASIIGTGQGGGNIRGIAPDADVTFYSFGRGEQGAPCTTAEFGDELHPAALGIQRAVDDGAQIVTTSVGSMIGLLDEDIEVIANAVAKGVVVIISSDNPTGRDTFSYLDSLNGVVVASAVNSKGELQTNTDGSPYIVTGTTVVAAGMDLPTLGRTGGSWDDSGPASGSSFAAPLVAGMLAVVKQKYPDATGNQLLQTLIHNTGREDGPFTNDPDSGFGYGAAWLTHMLREDPTQYPDENPLMKDGITDRPSTDQVAEAAARGYVYPPSAAAPTTTPSDASSATPQPSTSPEPAEPFSPTFVIVLVVLGIVILGAVITIVIILTTRKKNTTQGEQS